MQPPLNPLLLGTTFSLLASLPVASVGASGESLYNPEAVVPPQCYTKHEGKHNPCYVCHQSHQGEPRLNAMNDVRLQSGYDFAEEAFHNHWTNLFVDRSERIAAISDREILAYVAEDNVTPLAARLDEQGWPGYVPRMQDLDKASDAFDEAGFARDGSGWVAFNYKPLPSTFWPTNGSIDDVFVRLPPRFQKNADGEPDRRIYQLNLSALEAAVKDLDSLSIPTTDETALGRDLDGDGALSKQVTRMRRPTSYFGAAADEPLVRFLYPEGTEFLHSVRYLGIGKDGAIAAPPRMKELRYMKKHRFLGPDEVAARYAAFEEAEGGFQEVPGYGMDNGFGWYVLGFIEDAEGALRPQTHEEGLFCMGCHTSIGATIDQTFAFPRKVTGARGWGYIDLHGMEDAPLRGDTRPEILQYFERVGGGDEFRENKELLERFFPDNNEVLTDKVRGRDVYELITPSRERALALNKAYLTIVREQSYVRGRDANLEPMRNVYREVDPETSPTLPDDKIFKGEIRLDWTATD